MTVKQLLAEDDAVSPVVAVILMVAVTVILAAVIGTFVLGIGAQVTSDTPQVSLQFDFEVNGDGDTEVTVTHRGGDQLEEDTLRMNAEGEDLALDEPDYPMKAGDVLVGTADGKLETGTAVRVIWEEPQGQGTAIIGEASAP